jgi:hypothetical protein
VRNSKIRDLPPPGNDGTSSFGMPSKAIINELSTRTKAGLVAGALMNSAPAVWNSASASRRARVAVSESSEGWGSSTYMVGLSGPTITLNTPTWAMPARLRAGMAASR